MAAFGLACVGVLAGALVAAGASGAGLTSAAAPAACKEGPQKINGVLWVVYCGPANATARFSGKTVRFTSGRCKTRRATSGSNILFVYIGRRPMRGLSQKTKYWEHVSGATRDGTYRRDVFVEWWLGKTHYMMVNVKVTYRNKQTRGTFSGTVMSTPGGAVEHWRARGKGSGSFRC